MNAHPPAPRRDGLFGRPILTVTIVLAALLGMGLGGVALANRDSTPAAGPRWQEPATPATSAPSSAPAAEPEPNPADEPITLSATGDIIMGDAPDRLPANGGRGFFDSVRADLRSDLVMGNLEQTLTADTGASKCGTPPRPRCHAFRTPTSYAEHLVDAGFELLNTANNHSNDFGPRGFENTREALEKAGLKHTGARGQITVVEVRGIRVAVLGFSSYANANDLNDLGAARSIVRRAADQADVVVVQVHMGAEGAGETHVEPGSEIYYGENRGDPIKFSHAVVDAGADLVVGHGPHVLRGMEFYRGRLIAYSLGNFAGGGNTLQNPGNLKYGGILHVSLTRDGEFTGGRFLSTYLNGTGVPTRDRDENGRDLVAELSADDFGADAAEIGADGSISAPG